MIFIFPWLAGIRCQSVLNFRFWGSDAEKGAGCLRIPQGIRRHPAPSSAVLQNSEGIFNIVEIFEIIFKGDIIYYILGKEARRADIVKNSEGGAGDSAGCLQNRLGVSWFAGVCVIAVMGAV